MPSVRARMPPLVVLGALHALFVTLIYADNSLALTCAGYNYATVADSSWNISSPGYPAPYQFYGFCYVIIQAKDESHYVSANFQDLQLEASVPCYSHDYISVYDGELLGSAPLLRYMCGDKPPGPLESSPGEALRIVFRSDGDKQTGRGFLLSAQQRKAAMSWQLIAIFVVTCAAGVTVCVLLITLCVHRSHCFTSRYGVRPRKNVKVANTISNIYDSEDDYSNDAET